MKLLKETEDKFKKNSFQQLTEEILHQEAHIKEGGGEKGKERQKRLGRLTARERIARLLDDEKTFFELGLWAAYKMYPEVGEIPAAGVITGIGKICGHECMIIANDATVKAGAMFPQSVKKVLRAQNIAYDCQLPIIYLVDSSGVYLPMQDEIFPDMDDFGRIFRNNSVISASGIPQYSAIMGNCIAGGAYLPVLCDKLLMTEGSGLYLAGPALVKAAIGHDVNAEELGGAKMHAEISGTVDFYEKNDVTCIDRLRSLIEMLPKKENKKIKSDSENSPNKIYERIDFTGNQPYDAHELLSCIVDKDTLQEYKKNYGQTLVTAYAKIGGYPIGIVASQRMHPTNAKGEIQFGGVLYHDSADKAARFVMDCNQMKIPLIFLQDVMGFMVGKDSEQSGILRSGAKLVNAVSNCIVPKITVIIGSTFGAGNYALCGKAYDPNFILAWPNAKYAVMGAEQAAGTLFAVLGKNKNQSEVDKIRKDIQKSYEEQMDIRYGAARGWVDAIIPPHYTREILINLLSILEFAPLKASRFHTGVAQV